MTVRGVKTGSEPTNYVRVRVEKTSDGSEILNASASTTDDLNAGYYKYSVSYNYPGTAVPVIVKARYKGYIPFTTSGTITENGLDITAVWLADPNFTP